MLLVLISLRCIRRIDIHKMLTYVYKNKKKEKKGNVMITGYEY